MYMQDGGPISLATGAVTSSKELDRIIVKGAKEHNLKDIDIDIPKKKMVVLASTAISLPQKFIINQVIQIVEYHLGIAFSLFCNSLEFR